MRGFEPISELLPKEPGRGHKKLTPDELTLTKRDELILELMEVGIALRKAENLVDRYPEAKIRQQLAWLPQRAARRPASLLIAAIENDYDAPAYADEK